MQAITFHGTTDVGHRRERNEDALAVLRNHNLFMVADGIGGHENGHVASQLAVDSVADYYARTRRTVAPAGTARRLAQAVRTANWEVHTAGRNGTPRPMGTTLVALSVEGAIYTVAWVGDSRCYRLRDGRLELLTRDHLAVTAYRDRGYTEAQIRAMGVPGNALVRTIGTRSSVEVDVVQGRWRQGDLFVLCSDGVSAELTDTHISVLASRFSDRPRVLAEALVDASNLAGGRDNITALAVRMPGARKGSRVVARRPRLNRRIA